VAAGSAAPAHAAELPTEAGAELPATGWDGYRAYLDGLRAVAVYLVVLFHAGSRRFSGGFIGVDVFFVLSGFLVTSLLLRDLRSGGRVRLGRFYARRFRRLLPAAFTTLIITALVFAAIASPIEVLDAAGGFKAAFLYVTNWYFIAQANSYFGADVSSNPVQHFWSLAVEEQFYLLWPLLLGGLFLAARRFGSRQWPVMRLAVAAAAAASLVWAWTLETSNPNRAYYGTDARAYQLLAGALLALTPSVIAWLARAPRAARWVGVAALTGIVIIATTWPSLGPIRRGTLITAITVAVIAAMEAVPAAPAARLLSREPLVYLGKISYGTYLWHWPVILVITRTFQPSTSATIALTILIATALASLSYEILERPIRLSRLLDRHRRTVIAVGLATSVIAALVLIPAITNPTTSSAATSQDLATAGYTPVPALDWNTIKNESQPFHNCYAKPADDCVIVHGNGPTIMLIGDSHAAMLVPTFTAIAQQHHLTLAVAAVTLCPWQQDLYVIGIGKAASNCSRIKDDLYARVLPALHPDLVVDMNFGYEQPGQRIVYLGPDGKPVAGGSPGEVAWTEKTTTDSLRAELANAGKVVLVEPVPFKPTDPDPLSCLSQAHVVEECRFVAKPQPTTLETLYRKLDAGSTRVWSLDMDKLVCPYLPICDPIVNNQVVRFDGAHLTTSFAQTLAPAVNTFLLRNGIVNH